MASSITVFMFAIEFVKIDLSISNFKFIKYVYRKSSPSPECITKFYSRALVCRKSTNSAEYLRLNRIVIV